MKLGKRATIRVVVRQPGVLNAMSMFYSVLAELVAKEIKMPDILSVIVGGDDIEAAVAHEVTRYSEWLSVDHIKFRLQLAGMWALVLSIRVWPICKKLPHTLA